MKISCTAKEKALLIDALAENMLCDYCPIKKVCAKGATCRKSLENNIIWETKPEWDDVSEKLKAQEAMHLLSAYRELSKYFHETKQVGYFRYMTAMLKKQWDALDISIPYEKVPPLAKEFERYNTMTTDKFFRWASEVLSGRICNEKTET